MLFWKIFAGHSFILFFIFIKSYLKTRHFSQIIRALFLIDDKASIIRSLYIDKVSISRITSFLIRNSSFLRNSISPIFSLSLWSVSSLLFFTVSELNSQIRWDSLSNRSANSCCASEHRYLINTFYIQLFCLFYCLKLNERINVILLFIIEYSYLWRLFRCHWYKVNFNGGGGTNSSGRLFILFFNFENTCKGITFY